MSIILFHYKDSIFIFLNMKNPPNSIIVLDAGHGGADPGKVGVNDALEKDINLSIVKKLKYYLEKKDFTVILTRDMDIGLSTPGIPQTKSSDLQARKNIVLEKKPATFLSIHQNSFPDENQKGAQVFYYSTSESSKRLAECIQNQLCKMDSTNHRQCKANSDYFLLRENPYPSVIIECGFLSNRMEADLLITEEYQKQIAWNICIALSEYYNQTYPSS
ncbi:MAG: N-acetylmuramoyl-L-alanine amidase [Lachnospiraceae bacterium]